MRSQTRRAHPRKPQQGGVRSTVKRNRVDPVKAVGVREFFDFIQKATPEWAVAAVEARIDAVTHALVARHRPEGWASDVGRKPVAPARRPCFVLQLQGHRWCLVLRTIAWVDDASIQEIRSDARALSQTLSAQALSFTGQQSSGLVRYEVFHSGRVIEEAEWEGEELSRFRSETREKPKGPLGPEVVVDLLFRERGLYLPTCWLDSDGGHMWISLEDLPVSAVERADFLALRG